jgi:hypothetical protein
MVDAGAGDNGHLFGTGTGDSDGERGDHSNGERGDGERDDGERGDGERGDGDTAEIPKFRLGDEGDTGPMPHYSPAASPYAAVVLRLTPGGGGHAAHNTPGGGGHAAHSTPGAGGHAAHDTPGDQTPGGQTPGGHTPGGHTPGGHTPGGHTPEEGTQVELDEALEGLALLETEVGGPGRYFSPCHRHSF